MIKRPFKHVFRDYFNPYFWNNDQYKDSNGHGVLERFISILGGYFDSTTSNPNQSFYHGTGIAPDIDTFTNIYDIGTSMTAGKCDETFLNYWWEYFGEIPYAYGVLIAGNKYDKTSIDKYKKLFRVVPTTRYRDLIRYAISLFKIRGTKRFYEILGAYYGVKFNLVEVNPETIISNVQFVGNTWDTKYDLAGVLYDMGDEAGGVRYDVRSQCEKCVEFELNIDIPESTYKLMTDNGNTDTQIKQIFIDIINKYLPVHVGLLKAKDINFEVTTDEDNARGVDHDVITKTLIVYPEPPEPDPDPSIVNFVITTYISSVITSNDGETWVNAPGSVGSSQLEYGEGVWISGTTQYPQYYGIYRSADLITWTKIFDTSGNIAYGNGVWLANSHGNGLYRSTDKGITWDKVSSTTIMIHFRNGYFYKHDGQRSSDGITWEDWFIDVPRYSGDFEISDNNTMALIFTTNESRHIALTHNKGSSWVNHVPSPSPQLRRIYYGGGQFVVCGSDNIGFFSDDNGDTWNQLSLPSYSGYANLNGLRYGFGRWLIGRGYEILVSKDGLKTFTATRLSAEPYAIAVRKDY